MYGLFITLGIITVIFLIERKLISKKEKEILWDGVFWTVLAGIIGARIYFVLENWQVYSLNPTLIPQVWTGGLQIIGGFILGIATLITYLKRKNQSILLWLDRVTIFLPLGHAIGRIGNLFNMEHIPYAYYEIPLNLGLFLVLQKISKSNTKKGSVFYTYIIGYSIIRIILEQTRQMHWLVYGLNVAYVISGMVIIVSGGILWKNSLLKIQAKKH